MRGRNEQTGSPISDENESEFGFDHAKGKGTILEGLVAAFRHFQSLRLH